MYQSIEFGPDFITIHDEQGEVAHWVIDEWKEDSDLIFSIANAAYLAGKGVNLRRLLK